MAISDARVLASDLGASKDPVEKEPRLASRFIGPIIVALLVNPYGGVSTALINEAAIDKRKLETISAKKLELANLPLNQACDDFTKAAYAIDFQRQVYDGIAEYTENARKAKLVAGLTLIPSTLAFLAYHANVAVAALRNIENPVVMNVNTPVNNALLGIAFAGITVAGSAALYGVYNKMDNGSKLDQKHKAMAEIAQATLRA